VLTVQHICRGAGYELTRLQSELVELGVLATSGIAAGAPFEIHAALRRLGVC